MKILGIETSCDETAVAIVSDAGKEPVDQGITAANWQSETGGESNTGWESNILAHHIASQVSLHQAYGGVIPEVASRSHLDVLPTLVERCLEEAGLVMGALDGIAVAAGPGLIGGIMVGVMYAKAVAAALDLPLMAVNHLEGHALTPRLTHGVAFPYLLILMSGGHTQFLLAKGVGAYTLLGTTRDDALGEAFDKVARLVGLDYPGGPHIEAWATQGNPDAFAFSKPLLGQAGCDVSFSGLKTDVARWVNKVTLTQGVRADICASFQHTVGVILKDRAGRALQQAQDLCPSLTTVVLAGGVAANQFLRTTLQEALVPADVIAPPAHLCTDNGVMIAWAGLERLRLGKRDSLDVQPRPRWPLSQEG